MNRFKAIFILCAMFVLPCFTVYADGTETFFPIYEEDFEGITVSAEEYLTSTTTNSGIKSYDFVKKGNSTALEFVGYTSAEQPGNASRTFTFNFGDGYDLTKYPDTYLVVSFKENITLADSGSYTHTVINGSNGTSDKTLTQMFWAANAGDGPNYRCNNKGNVGKKAELNKDLKSVYIFDLENQSFDFIFDGVRYGGNTYIGNVSDITSINKMTFDVSKNHEFSLDDIYVFAVKKSDYAFSAYECNLDNAAGVSVNSEINIKMTSYISAFDGISIENVDRAKYTVTQKSVKSNEGEAYVNLNIKFNEALDYDTAYNVILDSSIKDLTDNSLGNEKVFSFTTEKKPKLDITGIKAKTSISENGAEISASDTYYGKYVNFTADFSYSMENPMNAYCVIALYDENDNIKDCGFLYAEFENGTKITLNHCFYMQENCKVKFFALKNTDKNEYLSDVIYFE